MDNLISRNQSPRISILANFHRRVFPLSLFPSPRTVSPLNLVSLQSMADAQTPQKKYNNTLALHPDFYRKRNPLSVSVPPLSYKMFKKKEKNKKSEKYDKSNQSIVRSIVCSPLSKRKSIIYKGNYQKHRLSEVDYMKSVKLTRITSSEITFPATNVGQIAMRVRDLVLDPLEHELSQYRTP
jgi:hypothetical protein